MSDSSDTFYKDLTAFTEFPEVTDLNRYAPLPPDWFVVVADITGSTKAIEEGRYKDVNLMGAACITAVINAVPDYTLPYVFGGDGATMTIPASVAGEVRRVLGAARRLARDQFDLDLRAGMVPVGDVRRLGADVLVAKFQLTPGNFMAMFSGGGVQMVDKLIKDKINEGYDIAIPDNTVSPDLSGLSCRWEPLKSCRGTMMSMLIYASAEDDAAKAATYNTVIDGVAEILQDDAGRAAPVSSDNMIFKWPSRGIARENKLLRGCGRPFQDRVWLYVQSFIQFMLEKFDLSAGGYNAPVYRDELRNNSDFRRFDDMLRMILDCPVEKADLIERFFEDLHDQGRIVFGTHRSDHALMTCLVFSLTRSEHVHFVDGTDGGFAMAAIPLKARMKALTEGNANQ